MTDYNVDIETLVDKPNKPVSSSLYNQGGFEHNVRMLKSRVEGDIFKDADDEDVPLTSEREYEEDRTLLSINETENKKPKDNLNNVDVTGWNKNKTVNATSNKTEENKNEMDDIGGAGGFFSSVKAKETDKIPILDTKPKKRPDFNLQTKEKKNNAGETIRNAFVNTWKVTSDVAKTAGSATTKALEDTADFLFEPMPDDAGYDKVIHGDNDLREVNKFTVFEEKVDRFLDEVLDGPEGQGNLGWYRRVSQDHDNDEDIYADSTKPQMYSKKDITMRDEIINESDKKMKELRRGNKDLLDEIRSLKYDLDALKKEKVSLEEELIFVYEQKENLRKMIGGKKEVKVGCLISMEDEVQSNMPAAASEQTIENKVFKWNKQLEEIEREISYELYANVGDCKDISKKINYWRSLFMNEDGANKNESDKDGKILQGKKVKTLPSQIPSISSSSFSATYSGKDLLELQRQDITHISTQKKSSESVTKPNPPSSPFVYNNKDLLEMQSEDITVFTQSKSNKRIPRPNSPTSTSSPAVCNDKDLLELQSEDTTHISTQSKSVKVIPRLNPPSSSSSHVVCNEKQLLDLQSEDIINTSTQEKSDQGLSHISTQSKSCEVIPKSHFPPSTAVHNERDLLELQIDNEDTTQISTHSKPRKNMPISDPPSFPAADAEKDLLNFQSEENTDIFTQKKSIKSLSPPVETTYETSLEPDTPFETFATAEMPLFGSNSTHDKPLFGSSTSLSAPVETTDEALLSFYSPPVDSQEFKDNTHTSTQDMPLFGSSIKCSDELNLIALKGDVDNLCTPEQSVMKTIGEFNKKESYSPQMTMDVDLLGVELCEEPLSISERFLGRTSSKVVTPFPSTTDVSSYPYASNESPAILVDLNHDVNLNEETNIAEEFLGLAPCPVGAPPPPPIDEEEKHDREDELENEENPSEEKGSITYDEFVKRKEEKDDAKKKDEVGGKDTVKNEAGEKKVGIGAIGHIFKFLTRNKKKLLQKDKEEVSPVILEVEEAKSEGVIDVIEESIYPEVFSYLYEYKKDTAAKCNNLSADNVMRYSRQLLLNDGFGVSGQEVLLSSKVLVVGAGGIGSTVLLYLAAAGIGHLTIVDSDTVESSNLHRQIIHKEGGAGMNKAISARQSILALNPTITCHAVTSVLKHDNAIDLVEQHDVVVDATDNPRTRYFINDACVLSGRKPLVSGSAMGTEGQTTVYNYLDSGCYRCMYPNIDTEEVCKSCSDNGVLGPVPGIIGILQSLEVIKILTGIGTTLHDKLIMYDSLTSSFHSIRKPPRKTSCDVCSHENPVVTNMDQSLDTVKLAPGPSTSRILCSSVELSPEHNVSCREYHNFAFCDNNPHILLDVRVKTQHKMCHLPSSLNIPLSELNENVDSLLSQNKPIYCICRRGISSMEATRILIEKSTANHLIYNIDGGLTAWTREVDPSFPEY